MEADVVATWESAVSQLKASGEERWLVEACFYDDPLLNAANRYHESTEWQAVRKLLPKPPGCVLDIGAGRGISAFAFARDGFSVTALEPDPSAIVGADAIRSLANEAGLNIDIAETWGEQLPFSNASFDVVHCRQVLHHARDLEQLCREVARVLRPQGTFIATREHVISRHADLPAFLASHPLHRLYGGEHAYLEKEYLTAIRNAGLTVLRVLNPYQSDINAYPETLSDIRLRWAKRLKLPTARLIPKAVLAFVGSRLHTPGRLYTFVGRKPAAA